MPETNIETGLEVTKVEDSDYKESAPSTAQDLLRNFKVVTTTQGGEPKMKIKVNRNVLSQMR